MAAPTNSVGGILAATASPVVSYQIGQYFKGKEAEGSTAHLVAHAVLGAAVAAAGGNDALAGALAAGGSEAIGPVVSKWLYDKEPKDLTAEEKATISAISAISGLAGAATGAVAGGMADAAQGNQAAHTAVDNNLNNNDWPYFGTTPEKNKKLNEEKFIKLICKNLNSSECQRKREEVQKDGAKFIISNVIDFIPIIGDIKGLYEAETVGDYVFAAIGVVPLVGDLAKKMHTAQKAYEKAKEAGNVAEMVKQTENVANLIKEDKIRKEGGNAGKGMTEATLADATKYFGQERKYWSKDPIEFNGNKVYQRNDLFDPNLMTTWTDKGKIIKRTNLERMASGRAPIGHEGNSINFHHMTQNQNGAIAEVTQTFHQQNKKKRFMLILIQFLLELIEMSSINENLILDRESKNI